MLLFCLGLNTFGSNKESDVDIWLTDPDKSILFQKRSPMQLSFGNGSNINASIINIDETQMYQSIDGFGFTLTGGSAMHINRMKATARAAMLKELFSINDNDIGVSYLRISIGASDLDEYVFSYNDLSRDEEADINMDQFSLAPDKTHLIPVLKEILAINPDIKIMSSPWSPPTWMKTNRNSIGGSLRPEYYNAYAKYFVKYIQEMKAEGIIIDAITIQNEPLHPGNNPSMLMLAEEQAAFVKQSLGPAFRELGINTKIILYDHNADRPDYPITVLNDLEAKQYVDGSAFHLYGGSIDALLQVHNAHPDKHIYFTEQWVGAPGNLKGDLMWHVKNLIIGATRNWSRNVLEWNLAADPYLKPHTPGGCTQCLGAITIDGNNITRNPAYYIIAHAAKFVRPDSVRIASNTPHKLPNVAFKTPNGKIVLIVLNENDSSQTFNICFNSNRLVVATELSAGTVGTYVW
ncbi:unnamed protein product [Didymodactylos carnosus]|uniref:Glucosylceramidase n=1 Tax=Didymodactylos carnosus TaxID=1234261 RepID=A0A814TJD7_9BILA|nr:unnamed protein product [Didymodactylos carnosus]CAF1162194.1 unnamed protein product [Didymodactylos carnosus]CAF3761269.1 unnamed protein product [Didymodactylos carnosus]CAF3925743.1 unnamed protein product [Didymodactylos carnosus]